jgi:hypothetical protein
MFNLFGKKKQGKIVVANKVWLSETKKWQALVDQVTREENTIIAVWFDETLDKLETFFSSHGLSTDKVYLARELAGHYIPGNQLIFAEHYPLLLREQELYETLGLSQAIVYSSLDEPIFTHFGGAKIVSLVSQLGMKEDVALENPLITKAITKAQEQVNKKLSFDQSAHSQGEWLRINLAIQ